MNNVTPTCSSGFFSPACIRSLKVLALKFEDETRAFPLFPLRIIDGIERKREARARRKRNGSYFGGRRRVAPSGLPTPLELFVQCNGGGHAEKSAPRPLVAVTFKYRDSSYRPTTTTSFVVVHPRFDRRHPLTLSSGVVPTSTEPRGMRDVGPLAC